MVVKCYIGKCPGDETVSETRYRFHRDDIATGNPFAVFHFDEHILLLLRQVSSSTMAFNELFDKGRRQWRDKKFSSLEEDDNYNCVN